MGSVTVDLPQSGAKVAQKYHLRSSMYQKKKNQHIPKIRQGQRSPAATRGSAELRVLLCHLFISDHVNKYLHSVIGSSKHVEQQESKHCLWLNRVKQFCWVQTRTSPSMVVLRGGTGCSCSFTPPPPSNLRPVDICVVIG